jgi:hypothetical protein
MNRLLAILTVLFVVLFGTNSVFPQHYYSDGVQLPLKIDSLKVCLKFEAIIGQDDQLAIIDSIDRVSSILIDKNAIDGFLVCSLSTGNQYESFIDSVQAIDGIRLVEPYYLTIDDSVFLVGDRFCAAFHSNISQDVIDSINAQFGIVSLYEIEGMNNVFVLQNAPTTGLRMLDLANLYYELTETRFAHPLFGVRFVQHTYKLYDYFSS